MIRFVEPTCSHKILIMNPPLHVEIVQKRESRASKDLLKSATHSFLSNFATLRPGARLRGAELAECRELHDHVEEIVLCDAAHDADVELRTADCDLVYHAYKLDELGAETDTMRDGDGDGGEECPAAEVWALPARELHGLWDSLVFESRLKRDLVAFVETAFEFAERGVDPLVVGWNRVVLLHGPPGTGKTSLCRALAQKLAARLGERFPRARLIEIDAHALFSKWFSESGKLVARLFARVHELAADERALVCVLVDEVESVAHARRAAAAGLEPSDSVRAVNALLTQLDRLRRRPNALVLATSNVTGAIDVAFADRADLKRRVGPPSARAAYEILRGCCAELAARGVVARGERAFALRALEGAQFAGGAGAEPSLRLWAAARAAAEARLSGRALRRLPFLARALHARGPPPRLAAFVAALHAALLDHLRDAELFHEDDEPAPHAPSPSAARPPSACL